MPDQPDIAWEAVSDTPRDAEPQPFGALDELVEVLGQAVARRQARRPTGHGG